MKKLLSICFLSIFLLMFGMQAQAQRDCCFSLANPAGDTLHEIVNLPGGNLPLTQTMQTPGRFHTDEYALVFSDANCLGIDYATGKVSIELELWVDVNGNLQNILDGQHNLSRFCDITLQTTYNELHWIGAPMVGTNYPYAFEYPGAVQQFTGTYNISNVNFDYFFFNFLVNSQTKVIITWKQAFRNVMLVAKIRERIHGTNNEFYWNDEQNLNLGGHQSHPAGILASDTLTNIPYTAINTVVKSCESVTVGDPSYTMDTSGIYKVAYVDTSCGYRIDSVVTYDYTHYAHPTTPTLSDSTFRYCQKGEATPIFMPVDPDTALAPHVVPYWYFAAEDSFYYAPSFIPETDTTANDYYYYVLSHDTVTGCESGIDTFKVTINPNPVGPTVINPIVEYCLGDTAIALAYTAPAGQQVLWGTDPNIDSLSTTVPTPLTSTAGETVYYLRLQDTTTVNSCVSETYDSVKVKVYNNPTVTISDNNDTLCFDQVVTLTANPTTLSSYTWYKNGDTITGAHATTYTDTNKVTAEAIVVYSLKVTQAYDSVTCKATSNNDTIKVYPVIGTPTPVTPAAADTNICGGGDVTLVVANGTNATKSKWYAADKTTVLAEDTIRYTKTFNTTDTVYVSSLNEYGCETPKDQWLRRIVTVDTLPIVTLSADNGGEVCAGLDLIIRSNPVDASYTYLWRGDSLVDPKTMDSVVFRSSVAGTYHDTLRVTNGLTCHNDFGITITVDTLPVIVVDVDYTVKDNEFCSALKNGKITFNTQYVKYSINDGADWRNHPNNVFDSLTAGNYTLKVEDGNGCVNKPANSVVIKDTLTYPALTIVDSANTRCEADYNGQLIVHATPAYAAGSFEYEYKLDDVLNTVPSDSVFTKLLHGNSYKITVTNTVTACSTDSLNQVVRDERATVVPHLSMTPNTHCNAPYGGIVTVDSVTPIMGAYHFRLSDTTAYQTDSSFTSLKHGLYTVFVEDSLTACKGSDTITVTYPELLPTASLVGNNLMCYNDTASFISYNIPTADTNTYFKHWEWSSNIPDSIGNTMRTSEKFSLMGQNAGIYTITAVVGDTVTHCENKVSHVSRIVSVNINLIPNFIESCEKDSIMMAYNYFPDKPEMDTIKHVEWFYAGNSDTATSVWIHMNSYKDTVISIRVEDNHGCSATKMMDNIRIHRNPQISLIGSTIYCENDFTDIKAHVEVSDMYALPDTIQWWKGGAMVADTTIFDLPLLVPVGNAEFTAQVKVVDHYGCKNDSTVTFTVIANPGAPQLADSLFFCADEYIAVDTTHQAAPVGGNFVWNTTSPNVVKTAGVYAAHYEHTQGTVTCSSENDTVKVFVPGKPKFTVQMKYNSEATASTEHERCYTDVAMTEQLSFTVTPAASAERVYTYTKNGTTVTPPIDIHRTEVGEYIDTINISASYTHPDLTVCTWDTTVYYTLIIDSLPKVPANFPNSFNGGDSTIFYCQGSHPVYDFNLFAGDTASYTYGTLVNTNVKPDSAYDNIRLVITTAATGCNSTFYYDIVEVANPKVVLSTSSHIDCSDTLNADIVAAVTPAYIDAYERTYTWTPSTVLPGATHTSSINLDTISYTFRAPNDTIVGVSVTVRAQNGPEASYTASCVSNDTVYTVKFQPAPEMPKLNPAYTYYVDSATAAYCASEHGTFTLDSTNFIAIPGAVIHIVGYTTVDTANTYKVVANNIDAPYCPSDTLTFVVREKRTPAEPTNIGTGKYDHKVYFCEGSTVSFEFEKANVNDEFLYSADGINFVSTKPDTAGHYFLRVKDVVDTCYSDFTFDIIKVNTPNYTVNITPADKWVDTNICQTNNNYVLNFSSSYTQLHTRPAGVTDSIVRIWNGVDSAASHAYNFTVTADTNLTFEFVEFDTAGNYGYGVACPFVGFKDTITLTYFAKPAAPVYSGDTLFCAGDSIVVNTTNFTLPTSGTSLIATLPVTFKAASGNVTAIAQYTSFTACKSDTTKVNIVRHELPTVSITPGDSIICKGDSVLYTASGAVNYVWSATAGDSLSLLSTIFAKDSGSYIVKGYDAYNCSNKDTVNVSYSPTFTVTLAPQDTTICVGSTIPVTAIADGGSGDFKFQWYKDDRYSSSYIGEFTVNPSVQNVTPDSSVKVNGIPVPSLYKVRVTDNVYHCVSDSASNVISVAAVNGARIEFRRIDSTHSDRYVDVNPGDQSGFEMYIYDQGGCPCNSGEKVYIEFNVYKNGVALTDAEIVDLMDGLGGSFGNNNTYYDFDFNSSNSPYMSSDHALAAYQSAYGTIPNEAHSFVSGSSWLYSWLYMHFVLGESDGAGGHIGRKITLRTGTWKVGSEGKYTFSYAVVKAKLFSLSEDGHETYYGPGNKIGGPGADLNAPKDTIVFDSFTINVGSEYFGSSADFGAPTIVTTTPEDVVEERPMDMKVYPNPASNNVNVMLEGISGQTMIMVYDMSGKVVSNMRVDVDNDGQIFNLPVDNYSQGIYFIKAVNGSAMMTKKLIIAR